MKRPLTQDTRGHGRGVGKACFVSSLVATKITSRRTAAQTNGMVQRTFLNSRWLCVGSPAPDVRSCLFRASLPSLEMLPRLCVCMFWGLRGGKFRIFCKLPFGKHAAGFAKISGLPLPCPCSCCPAPHNGLAAFNSAKTRDIIPSRLLGCGEARFSLQYAVRQKSTLLPGTMLTVSTALTLESPSVSKVSVRRIYSRRMSDVQQTSAYVLQELL